jgi:plastocyanin
VQIVIRRFAIALSLVCVLPMAACGGSADSAPPTPSAPVGATVTLGASSFQQTSISVSAGQTLRLVDPAGTGGTHMLCLGADGQCDANPQGPDALHGPGLRVAPGDTKEVSFPSPGQCQVTCTIHPTMNLTVSVLGTG